MTQNGLGAIIISESTLQERIRTIAEEINRDYNGKELILVGVLKGSVFFLTDLSRQLTMPLRMDFLAIGVKKDPVSRGRTITFMKDLDVHIKGKHVLLVEDVIGTGLTLGYVLQHLESFEPQSLKVCTLFDNEELRLLNIDIAYTCFTMPDTFVVGYGLDHDERYRNLPYIASYRR